MSVALIALFSWPVIAWILFAAMPPLRALIWTILGGYLFLPSGMGIDLPLVPRMDKHTIPAVSAIVMMMVFSGKERRQAQARARRSGADVKAAPVPAKRLRALFTILPLMLLVLPVGVYLTNGEAIVYELRALPAVKPYDIFSMALSAGMMVLPFLLGRRYLRTVAAHREILVALLLGGIVYGLLMLVEMQLSPQLNRWIYGYFPHSFGQHVRGGAYRPIVFLDHGLRVAIFMAMAAIAGFGLARRDNQLWWIPTVFVALVLILSPNLGALMILCTVGTIAAIANLRSMRLAAAFLAALTLFYPMVRGANLAPTGAVVSLAASISPARAQSLQFRLDNEDQLLAKANQKPLFGWGGWGRNRVQNESGYDISTTDGVWVIYMGTSGWTGYLAVFGMLTLPLLLPLFGIGRPPDAVSVALGMVLAANLVDLLPNSSLTPLTWLIAGALAGRLQWQEKMVQTVSDRPREARGSAVTPTGPQPAPGASRQPVYSRFGGPPRTRQT